MHIDHSLYSTSDRNAYFSGGVCCYDGDKLGWIDTISDNGTTVIIPPDRDAVTRAFETLTFPKPVTGLYQNGSWCEYLTLEPVRQWRKVFRVSQYSITVPADAYVRETLGVSLAPRDIMASARLGALFAPRVYPTAKEARDMLANGHAATVALSRDVYCRKLRDGSYIACTTGVQGNRIAKINRNGEYTSVRSGYETLLEKLGGVK